MRKLHNFDSGGRSYTFLPAAAHFGLRGHGEGREEQRAPRAVFHHASTREGARWVQPGLPSTPTSPPSFSFGRMGTLSHFLVLILFSHFLVLILSFSHFPLSRRGGWFPFRTSWRLHE